MRASARVLVVFFALCLPIFAQGVGTGTIRGRIMPADGETDLPGIIMVRVIGPGFQELTYASGGYFSFSGLPDGNYTFYVSASGREVVSQELLGHRSERDENLTIVIGNRAPEKNVPPRGETVVDVKTLRIPDEAQSEFQKGLRDLKGEEFQKAAAHFEKAVKIYPDFYQAHNNLGVAFIRLNRLNEAEDQFARAVEIVPDNVTDLKNLAYLRMAQKHFKEAIEPLVKAISLDSSDAKAEMYLGEAYLMTQNQPGAKDHYLKAALLNPSLSFAEYRLGYIFLQEEQYEEALKHFEMFLKLNPDKGKQQVQAEIAKLEEYMKDGGPRPTPDH